MEENTEQRLDLTLFSEKIQELKERIASVVVGQEQTVDLVLTAVLANGHVLIEGVPGVAKTLLARLTARLIDADFSRIQFTPDLMPSDVLGTTVFNMKTNGFDFHQGPIFADIVLVDEITRAPAKTYDSGYSEPGGAGGDIQTSRSAARPFSDEDNDGLSFAGRGSEHSGTPPYECGIGKTGRCAPRTY